MVVDSPAQLVQAFFNDIGRALGSATMVIAPDHEGRDFTIPERVILQQPFIRNVTVPRSTRRAVAQARSARAEGVFSQGVEDLGLLVQAPVVVADQAVQAVGLAVQAPIGAAQAQASMAAMLAATNTAQAQASMAAMMAAMTPAQAAQAQASMAAMMAATTPAQAAQAQASMMATLTNSVKAPTTLTNSVKAPATLTNSVKAPATLTPAQVLSAQAAQTPVPIMLQAQAPAPKKSVCHVCMAGGAHESTPMMAEPELCGDWKLVYTTMPGAKASDDYVIRVRKGKSGTIYQTIVNGVKVDGAIKPEADGAFGIYAMGIKIGSAKFQKIGNNQVKITSLDASFPYIWVIEPVKL